MAYDENLADRIRITLREKHVIFDEKKMMGGLIFMIREKMCIGIVKDELMARIGKDKYEQALEKAGCKEMNFTGKPMKGYVFIEPHALDMDSELDSWIQMSLDFSETLK